MSIKDFNFGDYSGLREYRRDRQYFLGSFIPPESFSLDSLRNNRNFILIGRKGTGKSTCCLTLSNDRDSQGYSCTFFNFSEDLSASDLRDAMITQPLSYDPVSLSKLHHSVSELYDFRDLWKRKVHVSMAKRLMQAGVSSRFTEMASGVYLSEESISEGVKRGLRIAIPKFLELLPDKWKKLTEEDGDLPLRRYNDILLELLSAYHRDVRFYFFFDELNMSHAKSDSSEYETLIALVRDIVRAAAELNDFFVDHSLDCHVICCMRPEVRNEILLRDNELSKTIDSNYVSLSWPVRANVHNPLIDLLRSKIFHGKPAGTAETISLPDKVYSVAEGKNVPFPSYFLNLTWYRPRDVVRVLKCYQITNGSQETLFSKGDNHFEFLKEYSRVSFLDNVAELEVKYTRQIINEAFARIKDFRYENVDALSRELDVISNRVDIDSFIADLFDNGFIYNFIRSSGDIEIAASYRDDPSLKDDLPLYIHRGIQPKLGFGFKFAPER